jgi:capsular exopolysaccharide synthesis family protein
MPRELNQTAITEDEIDLKHVLGRLIAQKITIFTIFSIVVVLGTLYTYFLPPIYQTSTVIRIQANDRYGGNNNDMLQMAMQGGSNTEIDSEIEVLKSNSLVTVALEQIPFNMRYFRTSNFKSSELYDQTPFYVTHCKMTGSAFFGRKFTITPDKNGFWLDIKPTWRERLGLNEGPTYHGHHTFGKIIKTPYFEFKITQRSQFNSGEYFFTINDTQTLVEGLVMPNLDVKKVGEYTSLVKITFQDNIPKRAQLFTNALANAYIQQSIAYNTEEASKKLNFIDQQLQDVKKELQASAIEVENFKQTHNTMDISAETTASIDKLSNYDQQLAQVEIEEDQAERISNVLKKGDFSALSIAPLGLSDPLIGNLMLTLSETERKKKALLVEYTDKHPDVVQLNSQIEKLKKEIVSNLSSLHQGIANRKQSIQKVINRNEGFFQTLPETERQYVEKTRTFTVNEKIYMYLLEKQSEASIARASTVSGNRIVDTASLPLAPIKPNKSLFLMVFAIVGLILGIAVAFLRDFLDDTIKGAEEIIKETNIPIIGTIPFISEAINTHHIVKDNPTSVYAESFRAMRTNLQFMATYANHKVIMITSTMSGEGKTTTASNLGTILAMGNKRVIVINVDLRLPMLHQIFSLPNENGMSNYLSGLVEVDEIIQHTAVENLDIISSGPIPPNPSELIMSSRMKEILEQLKQTYDYILLDTPPIGLVTDALILANESDISLFVIRINRARRGFAAQFAETVRSHDLKNTGIVLSAVPAKQGAYGYSYGYGYGYGAYGSEYLPKKSWMARWLGR